MFKTSGLIIGAIVLLQGCASSPPSQQKANVTSNPSGATVYANILELGKTPLKYNLYDAFPAGWQNSIYQAQGILSVKMDGCKDYTLKINDLILRNPIHAELECSEENKSENAIPAVKSTPNSGTEKRLEELQALFKKGVITEDEYKKTRERILNEL